MQRSELFRRGIVMPLTQVALDSLLAGDIDEDIQVYWIEIEEDKAFYDYWSSGVFERINAMAGVIIDDYEDEVIPADMLGTVESVIAEVLREHQSNQELSSFLADFGKIAHMAHEKQMPLFFVF